MLKFRPSWIPIPQNTSSKVKTVLISKFGLSIQSVFLRILPTSSKTIKGKLVSRLCSSHPISVVPKALLRSKEPGFSSGVSSNHPCQDSQDFLFLPMSVFQEPGQFPELGMWPIPSRCLLSLWKTWPSKSTGTSQYLSPWLMKIKFSSGLSFP